MMKKEKMIILKIMLLIIIIVIFLLLILALSVKLDKIIEKLVKCLDSIYSINIVIKY